MLTLGHLSASYLISQLPHLWGETLSLKETALVVSAGYILDLDLLIARPHLKNRASHHLLPTHTPLFVAGISILGFIFLKNHFSKSALYLSLVAMFIHLILDDIGYWFCKLGWQKESKTPQIFWLYPFDRRRHKFIGRKMLIKSDKNAVVNYLSKARLNVILEALFFIIALLVLISTN